MKKETTKTNRKIIEQTYYSKNMAQNQRQNAFGTLDTLSYGSGHKADYYRLNKLTETGVADISRLPFSIKLPNKSSSRMLAISPC